ncbi:probable peptidoglycan muropeptide transporter SLC46 isoform X2 [Periplaneta americana]|uniref:probable peptidoglycan muropeptide transporter SLC46 isoform X2 n=1 Tax=Periplaneta americana TaxID=6978 RepID=UPI0037E934A5
MSSPRTSLVAVDDKSSQRCGWRQLITVEPVMFLYMMAFMLTSVVEQAFFVDKACRVNLNFSDTICSNLTDKQYKEYNKQVQVVVSDFHQYNNVANHAVPLVLALFLGAWSDRRGRKLPLLLGLVGKLYYSIMIVVNALQDTWSLYVVLLSASLPSALTGADLAIFAAVFSYLADVTTVESRTLRVTVLDVTYLATMPTGVALGKYLWSSVTGHSFAIMFGINASLLFAAILYTLWQLKWRTNDKQQPIARNCCCDFFDWDHVVQSVKAVIRRRPGSRRMYLIILFIAMALYTFQRDEKPMSYLYTQLQFQWTAETYSDYRTFQNASYVVGTLLGIHIMGKLLHMRDTTMVMVGATAHALARVVFATAHEAWLFYVGGTIVALGPIVAPVLRSMTSKVVPLSERGKVFAILAAADNAVPLFSGVLYTQVYNATISSFPATIFWVTFASQVCVFALIMCIHVSLGGSNLEDKREMDVEDSEPEGQS